MRYLHVLPIAILGIVQTAGALDGAKGYDPAMNAACKGFLKGTFKCVSPGPSTSQPQMSVSPDVLPQATECPFG